MIAAVTDVSGRLVGVHRTYLAQDGRGKAPIEPNRMTLGPVAGAAVHLAAAGPALLVGEGIESTLSAMRASGRPGWAALSTAGLRSVILPPLPIAAEVVIAADHDRHGEGRAPLTPQLIRGWLRADGCVSRCRRSLIPISTT
jgi:hypothetical protein